MGFSTDESIVRVDFFKSSGKWYTTEAVKWTGDYYSSGGGIHEQLKKSLRDHFKGTPAAFSDMDAICLEPYHEHSHPLMLKNGSWRI
jgi:hypothetical protein